MNTEAHDRRPKFSVQETRTRNSHEKLGRNRAVTNSNKFLAREKTRARTHDIQTEFLVRVSWMENLGRLSWALAASERSKCQRNAIQNKMVTNGDS